MPYKKFPFNFGVNCGNNHTFTFFRGSLKQVNFQKLFLCNDHICSDPTFMGWVYVKVFRLKYEILGTYFYNLIVFIMTTFLWDCQIIWYLYAGFMTIILCSVHSTLIHEICVFSWNVLWKLQLDLWNTNHKFLNWTLNCRCAGILSLM